LQFSDLAKRTAPRKGQLPPFVPRAAITEKVAIGLGP
jgi:hypothetical protein